MEGEEIDLLISDGDQLPLEVFQVNPPDGGELLKLLVEGQVLHVGQSNLLRPAIILADYLSKRFWQRLYHSGRAHAS